MKISTFNEMYLLARRIRENQTFDHYAQKIEYVGGVLASGRYNQLEADVRISAILEELDAVKMAIRETQYRFVDINMKRGL